MGKKLSHDRGSEPDAAADAAAFRSAVRDVRPLTGSAATGTARVTQPKPRHRLRGNAPPAENIAESMPLVTPGENADDAFGAAALSFQRGGVRTQVMRRLRRGLYPCEAELDLHGLNQAAARDRLAHFIAHSRDSGRRCVRIIHGKGYRSGARGPVLKTAVDSWLRRHLDVMAFTSARAIDGGTGALYVLLRA